MKAFSIGYHDVTASDGSAATRLLYTLPPDAFRQHLKAIRAAAVPGQVDTISDRKAWRKPVPVFLTFDDGAVSAYTCVADELERIGWRGHFFVITDWIGRAGFLDRRQIRELHARGHVIGSHTCSHPERMSSLGWDDLLREWSVSRSVLSDILGSTVATASVANGFYSSKVGRAAAASGIRVLFTSEPVSSSRIVDETLVLGRYSVRRTDAPSFSGALVGTGAWPRVRQSAAWNCKKMAKALTGESYLSIRRVILSAVRNPAQ